MNARTYLYIVLALLGLAQRPANAQGCSDAGFCTIGALKQHTNADLHNQKLTVLSPVGVGDEGVLIVAPAIQYDRQLSAAWAIQAKLTSNYARGNLGNVSGLGDAFISCTYSLPARAVASGSGWITALTLGVKLPFNRSNLTSEGLALPMQYQSSLGTIDAIAGLSVSNARWQFAAGWQQPLTGANANTFLPTANGWPEALAYPPSNQFTRRPDGLVRVAYTLPVTATVRFNGGLLAIYHLGEDTYTDLAGRERPIAGSRGLTLNATFAGWWTISPRTRIGFTAGAPLKVRQVRPDGLTRSVVVSPEITWFF